MDESDIQKRVSDLEQEVAALKKSDAGGGWRRGTRGTVSEDCAVAYRELCAAFFGLRATDSRLC